MDNGQVKIFVIWIQYARSRRRNDVTALGCCDVREHFVSGAYLRMYLSDCLYILHTQHLYGVYLCLLGYMKFNLLLVQYYDLLSFGVHFRNRSRKLLGRLQSSCTYMISKVPSCAFLGFWTLTLKLTQHFDLIYNIGKSDWNILRNIMKTVQDSYTITIKKYCKVSGEDAPWKLSTQKKSKWPTIGHYLIRQAWYRVNLC